MKYWRIALAVITGILTSFFVNAQDDTGRSLKDIIADFYSLNKRYENSPNLDMDWGISFLSLKEAGFFHDFAPSYLLEIKYGFTRINANLPVDSRLYYASDNVFIGNFSSHLKPASWPAHGITSDNWRFGYTYRNGYGYILKNGIPLIFYHSGSIGGSKIDIENPPLNDRRAMETLGNYDVKYKVTTTFESGIKARIWGVMHVNAAYEHSVVYGSFRVGEWFGSTMLEFLPQRIIDGFSEVLLTMYPDTYPVINFVAKSAISAFLYEMKRMHAFYPFTSDPSINYDSYRIGLSFIF